MFLIIVCGAKAQNDFRNRMNVSLFGGYFAEQQNANNNGNYYGAYLDYQALKTWDGWSLGPYLIYNRSGFEKNLIPYSANSTEMGGGLTLGYYSEYFTSSYAMFTGLNLGYKHCEESGESLVLHGPKKGHYLGKQTDHMLTGSINSNLLKTWGRWPKLFPRTQLILGFQIPLRSEKKAYWNETLIPDSTYKPWNKTFYDAFLKQSIADWAWGKDLYCSPKLVAYYSYSGGNSVGDRSLYAIGAEISWHKPGKDDWLALNLLYKFNDDPLKRSFAFGASFNIGTLISK